MTNYEMFENQFNAIKSNCEISASEYEYFILAEAEKVIQQLWINTEENSTDEIIAETAKFAIKCVQRAFGYEPF